jgi:acetyl-CoA carboxylase carboxyltransferase component
MVEHKIDSESTALFLSGRLYDDGVIDPRDTRTILGLCLAIVSTVDAVPAGPGPFGVFRM